MQMQGAATSSQPTLGSGSLMQGKRGACSLSTRFSGACERTWALPSGQARATGAARACEAGVGRPPSLVLLPRGRSFWCQETGLTQYGPLTSSVAWSQK